MGRLENFNEKARLIKGLLAFFFLVAGLSTYFYNQQLTNKKEGKAEIVRDTTETNPNDTHYKYLKSSY